MSSLFVKSVPIVYCMVLEPLLAPISFKELIELSSINECNLV